jgi:diadenosine tetraphosphate (Ap4A) HIT family hydrolase
MPPACPFCSLESGRIVASNALAFAIRDGSCFDLSAQEQDALFQLVRDQKQVLDAEFAPDAYNIGINDGPAAGQTVAHVHIHLIPRYQGDEADPRGGVRRVLPAKARYWQD